MAIPTGADLWRAAASFSARAHAGQLRKDGRTPYAAHPVRVAMTVREVFGCDDSICIAVALLHDTIEDTTTDYDDLEKAFGREVAAGVAALTKNSALPEAQREPAYDAQLASADWRPKLVKLADQLDNYHDRKALRPGGPIDRLMSKVRRAIEIARSHPGDGAELLARAAEIVENQTAG